MLTRFILDSAGSKVTMKFVMETEMEAKEIYRFFIVRKGASHTTNAEKRFDYNAQDPTDKTVTISGNYDTIYSQLSMLANALYLDSNQQLIFPNHLAAIEKQWAALKVSNNHATLLNLNNSSQPHSLHLSAARPQPITVGGGKQPLKRPRH